MKVKRDKLTIGARVVFVKGYVCRVSKIGKGTTGKVIGDYGDGLYSLFTERGLLIVDNASGVLKEQS